MITVGGFTRPHGRLRVNYGSAFSHRLGSLWVADGGTAGSPARMVDLVANAEARAYGTPVPYIGDTFNGLAVSVPRAAAYARGASAESIPWRPFTAGGYSPGTVLWLGSIIDYDTGGSIYGFINDGGPFLQIIQGLSGQLGFQVMMNSYQVVNPPQSSLARNNIICVVGTTRSVTDHEVAVCHWSLGTSYATPISVTTFTGNAGTATQDPAYEVFGGAPTNPTSYDGTNRYHLAASWSRGMARDELVSLAQNPWQLVRPGRKVYAVISTEVTGDLAETEAADTLAATATVEHVATLAVTEGADTLVSTVTVPNTGELSVTEADDTLVATTTVDVTATLAVTESADVLASTVQVGDGIIGALGELALAEEDDTLAATAELDLYGDLDENEAADTLAAFVTAGSNGPFTRRPFLVLN